MDKNHHHLLERIDQIIEKHTSRERCLAEISQVLAETFSTFDWVGFYLVDETQKDELVLGPYVGDPTEHTNIAFGQGICGQAAATKTTFVVEDVNQEDNYLSCSPNVKSEIVVPIFKETDIVGELDIDSHTIDAFTEKDRAFLENVCRQLTVLF